MAVNVLIVDDSAEMRLLFTSVLKPIGAQLLTASDGVEATKILDTQPVNLIITDFRMPNMDGVELLSWCRERSIHVPVIFTTADNRHFTKEEIALNDRCSDLLMKPVVPPTLIAAVEAADQRQHEDCE